MSVAAATRAPAPGAWDSMVGESLLELASAVQRLVSEVAVAHGLSLTQVRLLRTLAGGTRTMTDLAGAIGLEKPSLTGLIHRAEARDLVSLTPVQGDRRVKRVQLTDGGRRLAGVVRLQIGERLAELVQRIPPCDQELLERIASQLSCAD